MALGIKEYWRSVRGIASKLDPDAALLDQQETEREERTHLDRSRKEIWLMSVENEATGGTGGQVISAFPPIAARYLKDQTHVLATDVQVAAHKATLVNRKEQIEKEEADRKGVPTSKLLEALVAANTAGGKRRGE